MGGRTCASVRAGLVRARQVRRPRGSQAPGRRAHLQRVERLWRLHRHALHGCARRAGGGRLARDQARPCHSGSSSRAVSANPTAACAHAEAGAPARETRSTRATAERHTARVLCGRDR